MTFMDWFLVAYLLLGAVAQTAIIGRPREPITPAIAAIGWVITLALVAGIVVVNGG